MNRSTPHAHGARASHPHIQKRDGSPSSMAVILALTSAMTLNFFPAAHQPAYAEPETLVVKQYGFSIWIPEPPTQKQDFGIAIMYAIKQGDHGFIISVKSKTPLKVSDETYIKEYIEDHQKGFIASGEITGNKVSGVELMGDIKGKGWIGQRYKMKRGDNNLIVHYGVGKSCVFVVTVMNNKLEDKVVAQVLNSITCTE